MPGGHELLSTNPHGLADKIIEAGRDALTHAVQIESGDFLT
jgi:hypothetical protein